MAQWILENYENIIMLAATIFGVGGVAEIATRLTKTKTDDGFVKRVGSVIDKIADFFKIPNARK